ncbi:MAG: AI-2E family transporter [Acetanaerobacterium sp.]
MKIQWNKSHTTIAIYAFLVICGSILFYLFTSRMEITMTFLTKIKNLVLPFAYGFAIAYLLNPLCRWFENRVFFILGKKKPRPKLIRGLSIGMTYLIAFVALTGTMMFIVPQIGSNLKVISVNISGYYDNAVGALRDLLLSVGLSETIVEEQLQSMFSYLDSLLEKSSEIVTTVLPYVFDITKSFTTVLLNLVVGLVVSIYVLGSKERIYAKSKKLIYALFNETFSNKAIEVTRTSNRIFSGFITGKIIDSLIIGVICFTGMTIFRFPFALLVSVIIAITNLIPYFGPFIGGLPCIILILLFDPMKGLGFALFVLVLQQFDGNILGPKILGQSTGLTPIWVMFAVIVGGGLFGVLGMFIGVPVFSVLYSLAKEYLNTRLTKKGLSAKTSSYASHSPKEK